MAVPDFDRSCVFGLGHHHVARNTVPLVETTQGFGIKETPAEVICLVTRPAGVQFTQTILGILYNTQDTAYTHSQPFAVLILPTSRKSR
jgi:hypothetical protein